MSEFHALVPAAGFGARMGNELPKQYLDLAGRPMIWHALSTLCANTNIKTVFVVLAPDDEYFARYDWSHCAGKLEPLYCGGATRAESVANGLLASELEPDDWAPATTTNAAATSSAEKFRSSRTHAMPAEVGLGSFLRSRSRRPERDARLVG